MRSVFLFSSSTWCAVHAIPLNLGQTASAKDHLMAMRSLMRHGDKAKRERAAKIMRGEMDPLDEDSSSSSVHAKQQTPESDKILNALSLVERAAELVSASQPVDHESMGKHIQKIDRHFANDIASSSSLAETSSDKTIPYPVDGDDSSPDSNSRFDRTSLERSDLLENADPARVKSMQMLSEKMVQMVNLATESDSMWKVWVTMANHTGLFGNFREQIHKLNSEEQTRLDMENDALVTKLMSLKSEETAASEELTQSANDLESVKNTMESEIRKLDLENQRYRDLAEHLQDQSNHLLQANQQFLRDKASVLQEIQEEKDLIQNSKLALASMQQSNDRLTIENKRMADGRDRFNDEAIALRQKTSMVDEMESIISGATEQIAEMTKKNSALRVVLDRLQNENSDLANREQSNNLRLDKLARQNEELAAENSALRSSFQRLSSETKLLEHRNGVLENTLDGFQGQLRTMADVGSSKLAAGSSKIVETRPRFRGAGRRQP